MAKKQKQFRDNGPRNGASGTFTPPWYTVAEGDNLTRIAERFGKTIEAIQNANGLNDDRIYAWTKLKIPGAKRTEKPRYTRLKQGQLAYVDFGQVNSMMRREPVIPIHHYKANVVAELPSGTVVKVVGDRYKDGTRVWRQVQSPLYNWGRTAWVAVAEKGEDQYLVPFDPCTDEGIRVVKVAEE
jgi:LysM repeat protein